MPPENLPSLQLDQRHRSLRPMTERQLAVLVYLRRYLEVHYCSPSVRDTCEFFGFKSSSAPLGHFRALVAKGMISPIFSRGGHCAGYEMTAAGMTATDGQVLRSLPLAAVRQSRRLARNLL